MGHMDLLRDLQLQEVYVNEDYVSSHVKNHNLLADAGVEDVEIRGDSGAKVVFTFPKRKRSDAVVFAHKLLKVLTNLNEEEEEEQDGC